MGGSASDDSSGPLRRRSVVGAAGGRSLGPGAAGAAVPQWAVDWRGSKAVGHAVTMGAALQVIGFTLGSVRLEDFSNVENPFGPIAGAEVVEAVGGVIWLLGAVVALVILVVRARRAEGRERDQYVWFVYAALVTAVLLATGDALGLGDLGWFIGPAAVAAAVGAAVLLHGLYDIRSVLSRSFGFVAAGAGLVVAHVAITAVLVNVLGGSDTGARTVATAVVAVAFAPLFRGANGLIGRALYGVRGAPDRLMSSLHHQVQGVTEPRLVLSSVAHTIATGLRLPYVAIDLDDAPAATFGDPTATETQEPFPLVYQGRTIGRLVVQARRGDEHLEQRDRAVLTEVATQLASVAHAVSLTESLRASRARLVVAREEERRRIRRDLHDGLGPMLTGLGLKLDVVQNRVRNTDEEAADLLVGLRAETGAAIDSVRRLVYGLRPPALDDLGLIGAIQEQAKRLEGSHRSADGGSNAPTLAIQVNAPSELAPLPAATEVAAFRIVSEAMTNMVRHSGAASCCVTLSLNGALQVEIADDGRGLPPDFRPGIGMSSMAERAAEVGGRCQVETRCEGGTRVIAWLPADEAG